MKPEDIPDDIWEAAEAAGEAMHGRHERGWVAWPLISAHGTASHREIVARALLAERLKEREACVSFVENGVKRGTSITDWRPAEVAKAIRSRP